MKDLYFCLIVFCFLVIVMVYCVKKSIIAICELKEALKEYKQSKEELLKMLNKGD